MFQPFIRRIGQMFATIVLTSAIVFWLIHLSGDPTYGFMQPGASDETRAAVRHQLGLDDSLVSQFSRFLWRGTTLRFGESWRSHQPAWDVVTARIPATLVLTGSALTLATLVGVVVGVWSVAARRRWVRLILGVFPMAGQAIPVFWLGAMLMLFFAVRLGWLPASGAGDRTALILPAVTLSVHPAAVIARLMAAGMHDVAGADWVRTARSKGLRRAVISWRHIAPNALIPVIGYVGLQAAFLIGGTVVVESVFAWPGVGRVALESSLQHDLPVVHAFVVLSAIGVISINLLTDVLTAIVDPRLRGEVAHA